MAAAFHFLLAAAALVALSTSLAEAATVEYQFDASFLARLLSTLLVQVDLKSPVC
jgi:hypothetical protein